VSLTFCFPSAYVEKDTIEILYLNFSKLLDIFDSMILIMSLLLACTQLGKIGGELLYNIVCSPLLV
jgi:hypothetical protein